MYSALYYAHGLKQPAYLGDDGGAARVPAFHARLEVYKAGGIYATCYNGAPMTGMSQPTVATLLLAMLLLPTLGALLGRLLGRWLGPRALAVVATLGFLGALGSAVVLHQSQVERTALGSLAIFVPAEGPLIDAGAFSLARPASPDVDEPQVALLETTPAATSSAGAAAFSATTTARAPEVAALDPKSPPAASTATDAPTTVLTTAPTPTSTPQPAVTPEPLPEPTSTPLPEPTSTPLPAPEPTQEPTEQPAATSPPPAPGGPSESPEVYSVREGDTLRSIAERFDISVDALLRYNGLSAAEGDALQLDQRLLVPPKIPAAPAATRRPAPEPQAYIVREGDTLRSIAERFDISVDALLRYNGLSAAEGDALQLDQKLFIPPT